MVLFSFPGMMVQTEAMVNYGRNVGDRKIDRSSYYQWEKTWAMIKQWQPKAAIFGDIGPDIRWVGNEEGEAGETSWSTL